MENDESEKFLRAIETKLTASMMMLRDAMEVIHKVTKTSKSSSSSQGLGGSGRGNFLNIDLEGILDTVSSSTKDLCEYTTEGGIAGSPRRKALLERADAYSKAIREIGQCLTK